MQFSFMPFSTLFRMIGPAVMRKACGFYYDLMLFLIKVRKKRVFFVKKIISGRFSGLKK